MNSSKQVCTVIVAALVGAFAAQGALASCKVPAGPTALPDGSKADKAEMLAAKRKVEAYVQQVSTYLQCEDNPVKLKLVKARQVQVADQFNAELRAFQDANKAALRATYTTSR